jgi:hypothetical protein
MYACFVCDVLFYVGERGKKKKEKRNNGRPHDPTNYTDEHNTHAPQTRTFPTTQKGGEREQTREVKQKHTLPPPCM